jgi:ankyrin repeat protein
MKKLSDTRHEAFASGRPSSAPNLRQRMKPDDLSRISETSVTVLISNAQATMATIHERRRKTSSLPRISPLSSSPTAVTSAPHDHGKIFSKLSASYSKANIDTVVDETCINQTECLNFKWIDSSKKLRPISANVASRAPNSLTSLQPNDFTAALSVIRFFTLANASAPKIVLGGLMNSTNKFNHHVSFRKEDIISRLKRACSVISARPKEGLTLLRPILHQAGQDLERMQAPEMVLAAAIIVRCSEVRARIQELQDWFHNAITKIRKESSNFIQSDRLICECRAMFLEIQVLYENFSVAQSQSLSEQQCVEELRTAHSSIMMMEVQDSRTLFEASAVCSAPIHATALLLSELQLLQQETNSMFHSFSSSFVSSFLESCALFQSIADSSIRSIRTKSTVSMPLSPDDDKNLAKIENFLEKCKNLPHDLSKFLFINDADKFAVARGFSEATSACTEFSQLCKQYAIVIENHEKNAFLKNSFEDFLHKHEFLDASNLLHQIEQNCSLISQESSNDLVFQCQTHFNSCKSLFEKDMIQVRDHIRLAQQSFARDRDDLQVVYGHIEAAQAAISNIRCDVPERTTLRLLVAKVKSAEARRYWHAKSSVQFGLSSVSETLTKCWEDSKNVAFLSENLAKLEATIESLRSIIDKFSIHDDDIINQVHALQGGIDDLNVLASGSRLEPLEITYSNCLQDFHKLVNESDELYQLEHGISLLKQIQCRLKRFHNRSFDKSSIESSLDMSDQCAREISRIELSRRKHLQQLNIEVADLKELLARSSAQDESDNIPKLHSRISYVRQVANAIDDQAALVEIVDLCRKCALVVEHRDNWLRSKVLVSLSEAESVFRNHRSEIPDLIAAIERLKDNHITVTMMMSSAVQVQTTSRIERTATHLKSCLILIQNDQQDKKEMLEALNSKLTLAIASYHDGVDDDASFSTMLDLQAQGIDLTPRIHIDAEISLKEFERLSLLVSKIHKRREQLSTMIADANSLCSKIDKWLSQTNCPPGDDSIEIDFKPLLLHLQKASIVIVGLHMFDTQDMRNLADRLQSLVSDVLLIAIDEMKKFLLNAHKDVLAIEHLLAANDFAPAVSIVDLLKDSIGYHQVTLLYLKFCSKTVFKFYKHKVAPFLASTRLLEFDLLTLIQHFDRSSHELPMLRAGVLAQGNALLNEAHMACVARKADIAREKLRLAILCLAKVCKPEQWQSVSENIKFLEHRCFSEAAASAALCKISQAHCKRHDYHVALTFLLSACEIVNRWNLNKITVVSTFEFVVSSSLEFLSGVCSASDEIWESFKRIIESGSACQGQNLISVVLGIVQHHKLIRDVMYSRLLGQESLVWDDILQREKPFRPNLWNSNMLQMSTKSIGMTKELMVIIESLEKKDEEMSQRSGQVLTSLSNSIQVSLYDSGFLSSARSRICDAIRERRLTDASCAVREVIVAVVTAGVSPDYMMSIYDRYKPLVDCIQELETSEPAFCIPYNGISLPHVKWLPPATVKLDVETSATVVANIADALNACLEVCCCALAEKDIQIMEFEMLSTENRKNIGFLYAAAALAPGAYFQVLSSRHSCHLDSFQTPDGLTLLHVAACYCNDQSLKVILENLSNPDLIFAVDCFGRNALHFVLGANRELAGVTESTMCSIFDSTYFKWVSLQECIAQFCPESRGVSTMGGFHEFSRHTPRHNRSNQDLDIVFRILQRDFSQHLERFTASDFALNNFMHYIARRSIKGHKASKHEHVETKTRSHRLFGNLHSNVELTRDQVVHQERGTRDLASLHQIFQIFQKPFCLTLLNDENIDGMTPLLLACSHGNSTVVALFILQLGADAACCDLLKRTPLHFAADHDDRHTFKLLLKCHGIDTSAVNIHGQTCLFRLICLGHEFLVSELMKVLSNTGGIQVCLYFSLSCTLSSA